MSEQDQVLEQVADWLKAGASGFGLGSNLYRPGDSVDDVAARAKDIVATWDEVTA